MPEFRKILGKLAPAVGFEPTTNGLTVRCATAAPRRNKPYLQRLSPLLAGAAGAALVGDGARHITRVLRVASPFRKRSHKTGCCSLEGHLLWSTRRVRGTPRMASWRSGYAEDCKSLHP